MKFPGIGNASAIKKLQEVQENVDNKKRELSLTDFESSSGGGVVTVCMNGDKKVKSIKISKEAIDLDNIDELEDLIIAALNNTSSVVDDKIATEMAAITKGIF